MNKTKAIFLDCFFLEDCWYNALFLRLKTSRIHKSWKTASFP